MGWRKGGAMRHRGRGPSLRARAAVISGLRRQARAGSRGFPAEFPAGFPAGKMRRVRCCAAWDGGGGVGGGLSARRRRGVPARGPGRAPPGMAPSRDASKTEKVPASDRRPGTRRAGARRGGIRSATDSDEAWNPKTFRAWRISKSGPSEASARPGGSLPLDVGVSEPIDPASARQYSLEPELSAPSRTVSAEISCRSGTWFCRCMRVYLHPEGVGRGNPGGVRSFQAPRRVLRRVHSRRAAFLGRRGRARARRTCESS